MRNGKRTDSAFDISIIIRFLFKHFIDKIFIERYCTHSSILSAFKEGYCSTLPSRRLLEKKKGWDDRSFPKSLSVPGDRLQACRLNIQKQQHKSSPLVFGRTQSTDIPLSNCDTILICKSDTPYHMSTMIGHTRTNRRAGACVTMERISRSLALPFFASNTQHNTQRLSCACFTVSCFPRTSLRHESITTHPLLYVTSTHSRTNWSH